MLGPLIALVMSLIAPILLLPFLGGQGLVDMPGNRRAHSIPTVRGGGIGISLAILFGIMAHVIALIVEGWEEIPPLFMLVGIVVAWFTAVGIVDDIYGLNTTAGVVLLALGGVAMSGTTIYLMMTGPIEYSVASMVTTAILMVPFTVWVTNAANFMDGINGITSLSVIICGVWTLFLCRGYVDNTLQILTLIVIAGFLGFLPWNFPRARIFPGESGAYVAGAATLVMCVVLMVRGVSIPSAIAPLAVYWTDVLFTFIYRTFCRLNPMLMHREHNYQKLQRYLGSHRKTVGIVGLVQLVSVGIAYACGGADAPLWAIVPVMVPACVFSAWPIPDPPADHTATVVSGEAEPSAVEADHSPGMSVSG